MKLNEFLWFFLILEIWSFDKQRSSKSTDDSNDNEKTLI